jgi:hypothetical protein
VQRLHYIQNDLLINAKIAVAMQCGYRGRYVEVSAEVRRAKSGGNYSTVQHVRAGEAMMLRAKFRSAACSTRGVLRKLPILRLCEGRRFAGDEIDVYSFKSLRCR